MLKIESITAGPFYTNTYFAVDAKTRTGCLIDPGIEVGRVVDFGREKGYKITHVLVTHGHVDHVMGANVARDAFGAELFFPERDRFLAGGDFLGTRFDAPSGSRDLVGGERLEIAGCSFKVLFTPGHTPGEVSFLVDDTVLFSGDTLFARAVGRTDLPGGDMKTLLTSIKTQLLTLDDAVRVLPGHGEETTIGRERRSNPFLDPL